MPFTFCHPDSMPATQELVDGDTWILRKPFLYITPDKAERIIIPASGLGSEEDMIEQPIWTTDYASIPIVFQNLFRKDGVYAPAYVLHDWLYTSEKFDRSRCDWILLMALEELGAWWITRNSVYSGVRCGGGFVWAAHDADKVKAMKQYDLEFRAKLMLHDSPWSEIARAAQ